MTRSEINLARALPLIMTWIMIASLVGCAQTGQHRESASNARGDVVAFVKRTMKAASGDWTALSDGPASSERSTGNGSSGVTFSWGQERTGATDPEPLVRAVAKTWKQHDYDVTIKQDTIDDGRPLWSAVTTGQAVESISVNTSPRRVSIEVQSACGTGDIADYE
ncbi:hypothetical protein [Curtobacterium sp. MCBA15_013]|uniref:hypothetical protein n=2 Tax=unclassified Curtobacterium TaxID=257496 RepID=UPI001113A312|nr:hypothetical protein [Curtobacterium sp. MCBA15_013]